jgi:hypothetical protein
MLKMKKIISILLGVCFLLSVTAAVVSAAPNFYDMNSYDNHNDGKNKYDNHDGKKKYFMQSHWIPGYWYWK